MAALLTVTGQVIFREHDHAPELFEREAQSHALNALETVRAQDAEKPSKFVRVSDARQTRKARWASEGGFWDGVGELFGLAADIADIFL